MKHIEDVSFRWNATLKRQLDGSKDGLFIVLQHQGANSDPTRTVIPTQGGH